MINQIVNAYKTSFSGLSRESWLLSVVILINRCGYMAVPFMGLYLTQALHRPLSDAGIIISIFGLGSILGAIAGGRLTDIFGFHIVQILSSILGGACFLLFGFVEHFESLCILAFVISFLTDAFRPANFTAVASYAIKGTETRSYSLNRLAINLGWAVGASSGGLIASINYKMLFWVDGLVGIVVGLAILALLPKVANKKKSEIPSTNNATSPWKDQWFLKFLLYNVLFSVCFFSIFRVVPVFYKEQWNLEESVIGIILGLNGVIIALFEMVMVGKLEHRRSIKTYITLGVLIVCLSFVVLLLPKNLALVWALLSILFFTFGEMLAMPFINTVVIKRSNEYNRGRYAAGYQVSWNIAQVIGPTASFFFIQHYGYNWLWCIFALILLACAYCFASLKYGDEK